MRIITENEARGWLSANALPNPSASPVESGFMHQSGFKIPGDAGRKTALARLVCQQIGADDREGLYWVLGYGIWPSSENPSLFEAVRESLGESRPLAEAPCHVFHAIDRQVLQWLIALSLYFSWDATLFAPNRKLIVKLSHDEVLQVFERGVAGSSGLPAAFEEFGLSSV